MASKLTSQQVRKQARQRATEAAAERELLARQRFEAELAKQREQTKANEDDLASFYGAEAAIDDAEEHLAATKRSSTLAMSDAAQAIAAREGSVSAAATLLGVTPGRISALAKAANAQRAATDEGDAGEHQEPTTAAANTGDTTSVDTAGEAQTGSAPAELSA